MLVYGPVTTGTEMWGDIDARTVCRCSRLACAAVPLVSRVGSGRCIGRSTKCLSGPIGATRPVESVSKHSNAVRASGIPEKLECWCSAGRRVRPVLAAA